MPVPATGEVLVRIRAASVNPVDWKIATGGFRPIVRGGVPRTMGSDFRRRQRRAIGSGVTTIAPGDRAFGFIDLFTRTGGTFAELPRFQLNSRTVCPTNSVMTTLPPWHASAPPRSRCAISAASAQAAQAPVNGASAVVGHVAVQIATARGA